jgi:serine/threonine protein kinase
MGLFRWWSAFLPACWRGQRRPEASLIASAQDVRDVFTCLEWLRELRVIHRAWAPRYLLRHRGRLFLIDFGYALLLSEKCGLNEESSVVGYAGSAFYTPNRVLAQLAEGHRYQASFSDDLESLVKLFFADRNAGEKKRLKLLDRRAYTSILDFWRDCECPLPLTGRLSSLLSDSSFCSSSSSSCPWAGKSKC